MTISGYALPQTILLVAAGIAAGSLALSLVGLTAAWLMRRRSLPAQHGVLLATLAVVMLLPALIAWLQARGLGWELPSEPVGAKQTAATSSGTLRPPVVHAPTLELPSDGSLDAEGMTVAEVMARFQGSTAPMTTAPQAARQPRIPALELRDLAAPIGSLMVLLWLAGSGLSVLRALRTWHSLNRLTRGAHANCEAHVLELLAQCASDTGLKRVPHLIACPRVTVPHVSGLWRPRIVLPDGLISAAETTLRGILLHELAHIQRRDLWVGWVQRLAAALYWWNPLVHRLNTRLAEIREDLCDNHVLARVPDHRCYAETLVELASQAAGTSLVPTMGLLTRKSTRLSGRIQRILQEDRPMATRLGGISKVLLLVFIFALGAGSMLFVIRLPDILPESENTFESMKTEAAPIPRISLVRNNAVSGGRGVEMAATESSVLPDVSIARPQVTPMNFDAVESRGEAEQPWVWAPETPQLADADAGNPRLPRESSPLDPFSSSDAAFNPEPAVSVAEPLSADEPAPTTPSLSIDAAAPEPLPADDRFPAPGEASLPESTIPVESLPTLDIAAEAALPKAKALVLVELSANPDGSVKQLRYLTEDLGNDDAAFQTLEKQIVAWAGQFAGGELTVQIVADPQLRYEHVARITKLCSPLVTRVVLVEADIKAQVTITVGFVRDAQGRPVVSTPVVFWQDEVVRPGELQSILESWINSSTKQGADAPKRILNMLGPSVPLLQEVTLILRCDSSVKYTVVESIMREARQAGFEHFAIQGIGAEDDAVPPVSGEVLSVDSNTRTVWVSIGSKDGLRPGFQLCVLKPGNGDEAEAKARLEVTRVQAESAQARVIEEDLFRPIAVGDVVQKVDFRKVTIGDGHPPTASEILKSNSKESE